MSPNSYALIVFFTLVSLAYGIALQVAGDAPAAREWAQQAGAGIIGVTLLLLFFGDSEKK